jgi:hypothetical protein
MWMLSSRFALAGLFEVMKGQKFDQGTRSFRRISIRRTFWSKSSWLTARLEYTDTLNLARYEYCYWVSCSLCYDLKISQKRARQSSKSNARTSLCGKFASPLWRTVSRILLIKVLVKAAMHLRLFHEQRTNTNALIREVSSQLLVVCAC